MRILNIIAYPSVNACWKKAIARQILVWPMIFAFASTTCLRADAQCQGVNVSQPVTVDDETTNLPNSRQLVNGTDTVVDTSTAGQIKVDLSLPNSGVTAGSYTNTNMTVNAQGLVTAASNGSGGGGGTVTSVNPGTETTIGGTTSAPTVNVQFTTNSALTANTNLAVGNIYPCNTSGGTFQVLLPDATGSANKGAHIVVFLKTAGNALSVATTSSQLINGQSAPISVSNVNTFLLFVADGTNWQCIPMQPAAGQTTNQWVAYIDALGVQHTAQIAFSNLSGSLSAAQMLALSSGQIYVGNSSSQPQATTPTAGTGLSVSAGSGSLQYSLSTPVSVANGGSGTSTAPTSGQLLIGTSGGGYSPANLTAGSNVTITNSSGGITIASSGSSGVYSFGGNGSNGAISVTSNSAASTNKLLRSATTYALSGSSIADTLYSGSIINANSTVTISSTGTGGGVSGSAEGCPGGAGKTAGSSLFAQGNGGGGDANIGGSGGASVIANGGAGGNSGPAGGIAPGLYKPMPGAGGGGGASSNAGGAGGGVVVIDAIGAISMSPSSAGTVVNCSGATGTTGSGAGGGGGAGCSFLYSLASITLGTNGTINLAGGAGGVVPSGMSNKGGGGGGGGGLSLIMSPSNTVSGTVTVTGGAGGTGTNPGTAGSNGASVTVTDTPCLPLISMDLDGRGLFPLIALRKFTTEKDHFELDRQSHNSWLAAFYAAPGRFEDLKLCLSGAMGDVDPRSLCSKQLFNEHDQGSSMLMEFANGHPDARPAEPVCVGDFVGGDAT